MQQPVLPPLSSVCCFLWFEHFSSNKLCMSSLPCWPGVRLMVTFPLLSPPYSCTIILLGRALATRERESRAEAVSCLLDTHAHTCTNTHPLHTCHYIHTQHTHVKVLSMSLPNVIKGTATVGSSWSMCALCTAHTHSRLPLGAGHGTCSHSEEGIHGCNPQHWY